MVQHSIVHVRTDWLALGRFDPPVGHSSAVFCTQVETTKYHSVRCKWPMGCKFETPTINKAGIISPFLPLSASSKIEMS